MLIICGLCTCEFIYLLKFTCKLKISTWGVFPVMRRGAKKCQVTWRAHSQLRLNRTTHCLLVSYCKQVSFSVYLVSWFLHFCAFWVSKKAVMCLMEKIPSWDHLHSGTNYSTEGHEFNVNELTLNQMSLNRNTHKTRLCIDKDVVTRGPQEPHPVLPLKQWLSIC